MSWIKTACAAGIITGALLLAACHPQERMAYQGVQVAKQACEINALAEEHRSMVTTISALEDYAPGEGTTVADTRWTILMEKLHRYRAETDATYRFVTSACNNYNMCMQQHYFEEQQCIGSRQAWMDSQQNFNQLAIELHTLDRPPPPHGPPHGGPEHHCGPNCNVPPGDCRAVNCNVQGAVFSTGCCYDGD